MGYNLWGDGKQAGRSVRRTLDGGFIISAYTNSFGAGGRDIWLIKTNSTGDTLWTRTYGGIYDDDASYIRLTSDGCYIVVGTTRSFGAGGSDVYLIKVAPCVRGDANGDGLINASDVVYLINYLFKGGPAPVPLEAGDVNCDGIINSADVVYLINYLFKGGPPPSC